MIDFRLAPKSEQPKGGFMHPKHLLAYGPPHRVWTYFDGWVERNTYCVAPSHGLYDARLLNDLERPRCTSCHGVGFWVETHLGGRREVHPCGH